MNQQTAGAEIEVNSVVDVMAMTEAQVQAAIVAETARAEGTVAADPETPEEIKDDTAATPSGGQGDETDDQVISTADGKSTIPFSVLKESRRREAEARQQAQAAGETAAKLREDLERLQAGAAAAGTLAAATEETDDRITKLREQAEAIREDLPAMAAMFDNLIAEIEDTRKARSGFEQREQAVQRSAQETAAMAVRDVIDNNPTLLMWEAENVAAFNKAADFDDMLKKDPLYKGVPLADRFAKAVELTKAVMPTAKDAPVTPDAKTLKERADKALKAAGEFSPETLSDLPGGASPAANPLDNLDAMSAVALAQRMESMTQEQLDSFIARHG